MASYNNPNGMRGTLSSGFPNSQFGQMFDTRNRETDYFPSQGFSSASGGVPIPGPFGNLISQGIINPLLNKYGIYIPPVSGYSGDSFSFIQSAERGRAKIENEWMITKSMTSMGYTGLENTQFGKSPLAIKMADMLDVTYGGSQTLAVDSLASRMSSMQRGSVTKNYQNSIETAAEIRNQFTKNGGFDYKKSYGFNMSEIVENTISGLRYGNNGVGKDEFGRLSETDTGRKQIAGMAAAQNEKIRMGKQMFGSDMSADQINKLMDSAMGGMAGITAEKSTDFLAKVQTTARALNINAKAFAEYLAMQQNLYKQMGISGTEAATSIMTAAITGDVVSQMAMKSGVGRRSMANEETARGASARNTAKHQGSTLLNNARAAAAIYDIMTPAQRAASGVDVQLTELETLISKGDSRGAQTLINSISKKSGFSSLYTLGANMNEDIADRASNHIQLQGRGDAETFRRSHIKKISAMLSNDQVAAVGGRATLAKALSGVDFNDSEEVRKAIEAGTGAKGGMASAIATSLVTRSTSLLSRSKDRAGDMEKLMVTTTEGRKELEAKKKAGELSDIQNKLANDRIGSLAKGLKIQDVGKFAADFIAAGGMSGKKEDIAKAIEAMKKKGQLDAGVSAADAVNMSRNIEEDALLIQKAGDGKKGKAQKDAMDAERKRLNETRNVAPLTEEEQKAKTAAIEKYKADETEAEKNKNKNIAAIPEILTSILGLLVKAVAFNSTDDAPTAE